MNIADIKRHHLEASRVVDRSAYVCTSDPDVVYQAHEDRAALLIAYERSENSRLKLLEALKRTGGEDGYLLGQIATFIGGLADAYSLKNAPKNIAEDYYEKLHALCEKNLVVIAEMETQS